MWLAARTENLGLGWVSLFDPAELANVLKCPADALPIAMLWSGPVAEFYRSPMLKAMGWRKGKPLSQVLFKNTWPAS
jgi:5,6-dimethylbenzimidazole synthase